MKTLLLSPLPMQRSDWEVQPSARHRYAVCTVLLLPFLCFWRSNVFPPPLSSSLLPASSARHAEQEILSGLLHHRHVLLSCSQHAQHFLLRWNHSDRYQVSLGGHKDVMKCTSPRLFHYPVNAGSWWNTMDERLDVPANFWTDLLCMS